MANKENLIKLADYCKNLLSVALQTLISYKYPLLFFGSFLLIFLCGRGPVGEVVKLAISVSFSVLIVTLILDELWFNRNQLSFVRNIYFKSGFFTYVRSFFIALTTLTLTVVAYFFVPPFMRWGWGSLISSGPKNVLLQPLDTIEKVAPTPATSPAFSLDYGAILIVIFWVVLILILPFWAQTEERIFRQGANSWDKICFQSVLFGLVHLTVGIPIYIGFVLAVPGFLFACRYKYAHDRYLKNVDNDELKAQEAGVAASTADHAIYNAIIISFLCLVMLILR